ncbi:MAG TPA: transglutaminase domain-containing protein, partial [Acidimicrobiales bacterium]|nr:transglutaminase domain-containing protein [Acidimicrobiales bacterium]
AAFRPISESGRGISFDPESQSLKNDNKSAKGMTYQVTSVVPSNISPAQLETSDSLSLSREMRARYTQLPRDYPQNLRDIAGQIVANASNEYERALALQQWFRTKFTYDLSFRAGHSENAMETFINERRGYCEQFAATYAAFARSINLPARVAVGFTYGDLENGVYVVKGQHYHAWPEVYFEGVGWVPFEPTPSRGIPGAQSYTGVAQDQAGADEATPNASADTTAAAANGATPSVSIPTGEELEGLIPGGLGGNVDAVGLPGHHAPSVWPRRLLYGLGMLVVGAVLWAVVVPLARRRQRHNRRKAATTPSARVLVAWEEAAEAFSIAGIPPKGPETYREFAARAATATPVPGSTMRTLADDASAAQFSAEPLPAEVADRAEASVTEIEQVLSDSTPVTRKLLGQLDPRTLRKPATKRKVQEAEHPVRV